MRVQIRSLALGLFLLAIFTSPMDATRVGPIGAMADVLLLAASTLALARFLLRGRPVPAGRYVPVVAAAALLALAGAIGTFNSTAQAESFINLMRFIVTTMLMPLAVASLAPRRAEVRRMAWAYVLGCTASSLVSFTAMNPVVGRSAGLSSHPNVLGISVAFALALLAGLVDRTSVRQRWYGAACAIVLLGGLSRSGSRAAVIALLVGLGAYLAITHRYRAAWYLLTIVVIGASVILAGFVGLPGDSALGRITQASVGTRESNEARAVLAAVVIERVDSHPIMGSGFGNATEAHNIYIQIVDIGGLLAIAGFVALTTSILRSGWAGRRDPMVVGPLAMYIGYLTSGIVANSLWDRWLWFPIVIGLAASQGSDRAPRTSSIRRVPQRT